MVGANTDFDIFKKTSNSVGVDAPYVILSNTPEITEDSIILDQSQGTLLSYVEDLNNDTGNYEIAIELIDPDGQFISKMFSFHYEHIKSFYTKLAGPTLENFSAFNRLYDEEIHRLTEGLEEVRKMNPGAKADSFALTLEKKERLEEIATREAFKKFTSGKGEQSARDLKQLLDELGYHPHIYIDIGIGTPQVVQGKENKSGLRRFFITGIDISQDTGREQVITVLLGPLPKENIESKPVLTSEEKIYSYYPSSEPAPVLYHATFANIATYQDLDVARLPLSKLHEDNSSNLVSIIEYLIQGYLLKDNIIPIAVISPELDIMIKTSLGISNDSINRDDLIKLARSLEDCGIKLVLDLKGETIQTNPVYTEAYNRAPRINYKISVKLRVDEELTPEQNVLSIINSLYKKFDVKPSDVSMIDITNVVHKKLLVKKLFTNYKKFGANEYRDTYKLKRYKDPVRNDRITIQSEQFESGDFPNLRIVGDDFLIQALMFPADPDFANSRYDTYRDKLNEIGPTARWFSTYFLDRYSNAIKFLSKNESVSLRNPYTYRDYVEDFSRDVYKSRTGIVGAGMMPDEFSIFSTDREVSIANTIPIFIANLKNSNVISVTSKENGFAFSNFQEFFTLTSRQGIGNLKDALSIGKDNSKYVYELTEEDIDYIIDKVLSSVFTNVSLIRALEHITDLSISKDSKELSNLKNYYLSFIEELKNSPYLENKKVDVESVINYLTYLDKIAKQVRTIVIKVEPQFYISSLQQLKLPVLFYHENPYITSSESPFSRRSLLSGMYEVIGYKHTITSSECYTDLVLQRNPLSDSFDLSIKSLSQL